MKTGAAAAPTVGKEGKMVRRDSQPGSPRPISAQFFLWTIRKQDHIARGVTMNIWSAVSAVLAIALVGLVTLEMALQIILAGGAATGALIWILIERRRSWLLSISDPQLKAEAHQAMIDYLVKKTRYRSDHRRRMNQSDVRPTAACFCPGKSRDRREEV
jgi:hypothetical protein